jgi:hypothetical protein
VPPPTTPLLAKATNPKTRNGSGTKIKKRTSHPSRPINHLPASLRPHLSAPSVATAIEAHVGSNLPTKCYRAYGICRQGERKTSKKAGIKTRATRITRARPANENEPYR